MRNDNVGFEILVLIWPAVAFSRILCIPLVVDSSDEKKQEADRKLSLP